MVGVAGVANGIVERRRLVIVVLLLLVGAIGAGASQVEESSSFSQFETDSTEAEKLSYIDSNFSANDNTTTAQVIVRGDNVLSRASLLDQLRFQRALEADATVNETLSADRQPVGVANLVATTSIREEQAANLSRRGQALRADQAQLNRTGDRLSTALNRTRGLQQRYEELNRSQARGETDNETYRQRSAAIEQNLSAVREDATTNLSDEQAATFDELVGQTRTLQSQLASLNASYAAGEINQSTYQRRAGEIQAQFGDVYGGIERVLAPDAQALQERAQALRDDRTALQASVENGEMPPLSVQIEKIESMNASAVESTVGRVLGDGSDSGAFALMPTGYEPGSTTAEASMVVITQTTRSETTEGTASDRITQSQLAIQDIARTEIDGESMVFGQGIIADETNRSMQDSLTVVGPLAALFVLVVLTFAYRDLADILLGLLGLGLVLLVTFGFMGWAGVTFNQLFVAIPVLLIGLSIDYAIHVFMRHREERATDEGDEHKAVARAMRVALAGVGTALVLVTATTVIGFLSNLTSPVAPIREFGVVSAVGIVGALVVFGALIPAIKVEVDSLLDGHGFDRRKPAFGTGGGRISRALAVGAVTARRAPRAVILLTLLVSAAGAYGALGVDTTFQNEDFIAEEPPEWMDRLPASMQPGEYAARSTFEYVNENFLREDSQVEFLYEGDVGTADALQRVDRTRSEVAAKPATVTLSNGEPNIASPLTVMRDVAATNQTFNATFTAADTDGDGVPDESVTAVYDALFAAAPDRAGEVIHRDGGEYRALRLRAAVSGGASGQEITDQMDEVERSVSGGGVTVTATGSPIVNKLVQDALLQTVVESLLITLVVSFVFLMAVYRFTDGSATLGLVTLLPVVFNVTWILGTMYVLDIPFNVLTGMITSLTIGLGVAYSIHISERYSLELGRRESATEAMHTAVIGTGGALLGSAATTVGGFGVLVFAILPPLQQFGFITGLTIVYAFFASVFVLPSLLTVWTRHFGPTGVGDEGETPGGDGTTVRTGPGAPVDDAGSPDGAVSTSETGATAVTTRASDETAGSSVVSADKSDGQVSSGGSVAARTNGHGRLFARRTVKPTRVRPGGDLTVTVTFPDAAGRVVLSERVTGSAVQIDAVNPTPVDAVASGDQMYVVWEFDDPTEANVEYTATVSEGLAGGETVDFDGEALFPDHVVAVAGVGSVAVTTDVVGGILADGHVSDRDVADAGRHLATGGISTSAFEQVYHAWLDEHASTAEDIEDD